MLVVYSTVPNETIRKEGEEAIAQLETWFENNPKRKTCKAEMWYGQMTTIRRGHIIADMEKAIKKACK